MIYCDNEREHEREGREDFRRKGSYGYDREKYAERYYDDCARAYMHGFDQARRDEERRQEERAEEKRQQAAYERRLAEERQMEQYYEEQYYGPPEQFPEPEYPEPPPEAA